jgi:hypothetical protein
MLNGVAGPQTRFPYSVAECGSATFWCGSVPYLLLTDPDPTPDSAPAPAIFVSDLQDGNKNIFWKFFHLLLSELYLHHFSRIKSHKEVTNSRNQDFLYYFCLMIEGSGAGSVPRTNGSGSAILLPYVTYEYI